MLGRPDDKQGFRATYAFVGDEDDENGTWDLSATLSDTRRNQPRRSPEWRLGYPGDCPMIRLARPSDAVWIARYRREPDHLLIVVSPRTSDAARRLDHIFGTRIFPKHEERVGVPCQSMLFEGGGGGDAEATGVDADDVELLKLLGIEVKFDFDSLLSRFLADIDAERRCLTFSNNGMVSTRDFASFVMRYFPVDAARDPDLAVSEWWKRGTELCFRYEQVVVGERVKNFCNDGWSGDVDAFLKLALSISNSRKSRAGRVFEEFLSAVFAAAGLQFDRTPVLEDGSRPDFVMPSHRLLEGDDPDLDVLTFLGAKTTAKERWREQMGEARKIGECYFATIDDKISVPALKKMNDGHVVPVIPSQIAEAVYHDSRRLFKSFGEFIEIARGRENLAREKGILV